MLSHRLKRTRIFRIICMVMLVLIQFDAYGYEIMGSFKEDIEPVSSVLSITEDEQADAEWSDPVYRVASSTPRAFVKFTLIFLCSLSLISVCIKTVSLRRAVTTPVVREASCACLLYCMLII